MDYRKWLVFNSELTNQEILSDLHQSLKKKKPRGKIGLTPSNEEKGNWYVIETAGFSEQLKVHIDEFNDFIAYLEEHYLVKKILTTTSESTTITQSAPYSVSLPLDSSVSSWFQYLFYNRSIRKHVVGYVIVGFTIVQIFILPQFFHKKLPEGTHWTFLLILLALSHFAVRNYKNRFLTGGIRYYTVFSITAWLHLFLFLGISIENVVGDSVTGSISFTVFSAVGLGVVLALGGLFIGWILSIIVYFTNGGKMVTDPTKVNYK